MLVAVSSPWASGRFVTPIVDLAQRLQSDVIVSHVTEVKEEDENDVAKAILNTAKARNCTMIVLGFSGEGFLKGIFKRLLASDVVSSILKQSELPVLLCPTNWQGTL